MDSFTIADYPSEDDGIGFRKPDGSMGITEFSARASTMAEHVMHAAVKEAVEYFRVMPDREKAERLAAKAFITAINAAAMLEVQGVES